jgi:hypothetical protein
MPGKSPAGVLNIAHRGARVFAPENTLAAFRKAQIFGCQMFEIDVLLTLIKLRFGKRSGCLKLGTGTVLAELLKQEFGVTVSDSAVRLHLKALGLTCKKT